MIEPIHSAGDPRLQSYARVGEHEWLRSQGIFVAEGRMVVERVLEAGSFRLQSVLVTPAARRSFGGRLDTVETPVWVCSQHIMQAITGFGFHRGCLALVHRPVPACVDDLMGNPLLLALHGVGNPDNVGGLFRTAAAFGAGGVLVGTGTADPYYRKAVRTSMGGVLQVQWAPADPWPDSLAVLRAYGYRIAALTPRRDARSIDDFAEDRHGRVVLLFGSEGEGLPAPVLAAADDLVRIPIVTSVDSLNVTVAAGIALHALSRHLHHGGNKPASR